MYILLIMFLLNWQHFFASHAVTLIALWSANVMVVMYLWKTMDVPFHVAPAFALPQQYKAKLIAPQLFGYEFRLRLSIQRVVI